MSQLFSNAARSPLMANILAADTSLTVDAALADLYPVATTGSDPVPTVGKDFFKIVLENAAHEKEIVYVRTRALGDPIMSNVLRGQEGTTARAYTAGDIVGLRHTAADLADAIDLAANATASGKAMLNAVTAAAQWLLLVGELQAQTGIAFTTAGTSTAYTLTPTPAITAYAAGQSFWVTLHTTSGASPRLAISGVATPPNIVRKLQDGSYQNVSSLPAGPYRITLVSATQALAESVQPLIVGTVSQTAGIPTGSIIEVGSNANGRYTRWADGTQICTFAISVTTSAANTIAGTSWTFPAAFASEVRISATVDDYNTNQLLSPGANAFAGGTSVSITLVSGSTGVTKSISVVAYGRWY